MNWGELFQNLLYAVIIAVVPLITRLAVVYINSKIQQRTNELENENLQKYINAATEAVSLAVLSVQQTYTDSLKAAGKFDKEAQKMAKSLAMEKAKTLITKEAKSYVEMLYGDFESWIDQSIETMVRESKITMLDEVIVKPNNNDSVNKTLAEYVADPVPVTE